MLMGSRVASVSGAALLSAHRPLHLLTSLATVAFGTFAN
jgi:hypothetical protein